MEIILKNRLAILLRQRNIPSASEFGRLMTAAGCKLSSSHASRYEKQTSPPFDLNFINIACNVLQCLPNELYDITIKLDPNEKIDPLVVIPRHAIVVESNNVENEQKKEQPKEKIDVKFNAEQENTKINVKKRVTSEDTGPTRSLFPSSIK